MNSSAFTPTLSAFTFLRNADMLAYPYIESISSLAPYVDEYIVHVGEGQDDTLINIKQLQTQFPHIKISQSVWNESMSAKGFVYAQQKMIAQYQCTSDWAFYLEGDEVLHEQDAQHLRRMIALHHANAEVEAFAFHYHHFYGCPNYVAVSPAWYRYEARIIRNTIRTYCPDGLFWVVMVQHKRGRYPKAVLLDMDIYHYGHVRSQVAMQAKARQVSKYWDHAPPQVDYTAIDPQSLRLWDGGRWGSHPAIMQNWLRTQASLTFIPNAAHRLTKRERKHRYAMQLERLAARLGWSLSLAKKHFYQLK